MNHNCYSIIILEGDETMIESKEKYIKSIKEACNEMRLDYFPQVEASELLYRVITLEDIYLPLSLDVFSYDSPIPESDFPNIDIDELIRRIDEKIAALEKEEIRGHISAPNPLTDDIESSDSHDMYECKRISSNIGLRLLIEANPGSGKTTFCKRLVLAILNNDESFLKKYSKENGIYFNTESMPIFVSCKNIADLSKEELNSLDFKQLMYKLCVLNFGAHFSEIMEAEFVGIIDIYEPQNICVILDGWDEILDTEKGTIFCEKLNNYIEQYSMVDVIITMRFSYVAPQLAQPYSGQYKIRPLSDADIREFCKKWCEIIFSPNQQRAKNYSLISEQILSSKDQQIKAMMKNPLDLSLLLTVSKNDGRLPENKADLFKELVDLYIFWSKNKSKGSLSAKSIRVFLAYIASSFTKNNRLYCDEKELLQMVSQAISDLEWTFSEDISCFEPHSIAQELSHTGILTRTYDGKRFSFSESTKGTHRQMQEYLTAYAILAQYSDEEYNSMSPIDIFEDKYGIRQWREVIIFITLMNNGRLRQEIVKRLILKAEKNPEDNYIYTNLLFDLIVNGADISLTDKHKIYDILFSEHITDQQIENIDLLVTSTNRSSSDFITYINDKFSKSVEAGDSEYGYAKAVIEASIALQQGVSPFKRAEILMKSDREVDIVAGSQILIIMAWCKYVKIRNAFSAYYVQYRMSSEWIGIYKSHIEKRRCTIHLLKSIREAIVADFATFYDFFTESTILEAYSKIDNEKRTQECEIILSIAPIFDSSFHFSTFVDDGIKEKYLQKLNSEILSKDYDEIVFSFSICSSIGCFSLIEQEEKWNEIAEIYKKLRDGGYFGKARYIQLNNSLRAKEFSGVFERLRKSLFSSLHEPNSPLVGTSKGEWVQSDMDSNVHKEKRSTFSENDSIKNIEDFLDNEFQASGYADNKNELNSFILLDENGKKTKYDVLITFDSEETGKSYIVYTDNSRDKKGNVQVFASNYILKDMRLMPIETEKEWRMIEIILEELQKEIQSKLKNNNN